MLFLHSMRCVLMGFVVLHWGFNDGSGEMSILGLYL